MNQEELVSLLTRRGMIKWVKAYEEISLFYDEQTNRYLLVEQYGSNELWWSEGWRAFHFPRTSSIVDKAWLVGNRTYIMMREGRGELRLVPSLSPVGIEALEIVDSQAYLTYGGLGGGGVSASYGRGLARGVDKIDIHHHGGGMKIGKATLRLPALHRLLLIAVDDTDTESEGATYATVANIAKEACRSIAGISWVINVEVNLFPHNPRKTRNGFASLAGFKLLPGRKEEVLDFFATRLLEETRSGQTSMCSYEGFDLPSQLLAFSDLAKNSFVESVDDALRIARNCNVQITPITGQLGTIGALAALGYWNRPQEAVDIGGFLPIEAASETNAKEVRSCPRHGSRQLRR